MNDLRILKAQCENCGSKLQVKSRSSEKTIACPKCKAQVILSVTSGAAETAPASASKPYVFSCPHCDNEMEVNRKLIGKSVTCGECEQRVRVPEPSRTRSKEKPQKSNASFFGLIGLVCELIFFVGIAIKPGSFEAVMYGGALGLAGVVVSIMGIAANRGRVLGTIGIVVFFAAWAVNTLVIGRL